MKKTAHRNRRMRRRLIINRLAILLLAIVVWMGSMGLLALSLQNHAAYLLQMAADPTRLNISAVAQQVHGARQDLAILRGELAPLLWISTRMGGHQMV